MEEIGEHCGYPLCKQLDFLPFFCSQCQNFYCLQHRTQTSHECPEAKPPEAVEVTTIGCKRCRRLFEVPDNMAPDVFLTAHMQSAKCAETERQRPRCSLVSCTSHKRYCLVQCKECSQLFCVSHRFPADHQCPVAAAAEASRAARSEASAALVAQARERLRAGQALVASQGLADSSSFKEESETASSDARAHAANTHNSGHRFIRKTSMTAKGLKTMKKVEAMKIKVKAKPDPSISERDQLAVRVDWQFAPKEKLPANLSSEDKFKEGAVLMVDGSKSVGWNLDRVCSKLSIRNANAETGPHATFWAFGIYDMNPKDSLQRTSSVVVTRLESTAQMKDCVQDGSVLLLLWEE
ncbi:zinc finger an1 domain-containing stress-associated protein 12 [Cystoisospora suis]|uniref:Zinc finger an1 domain-containing stress-associated protein 12 n=1 Tax=Cystoisospora suis TaxID=483139 RepID=A0A2C6JAI5_9APIC|nr:zinc finger an1 domain-containing stress-associated protein 12 [Cystoisospora suis]